MQLDITPGGSEGCRVNVGGNVGSSFREVLDPVASARAFLETHHSAKIVVVIDTHCLENGAFIYEGNSPSTSKAYFLPEVSALKCSTLLLHLTPYQLLVGCIPHELFQYLSSAEDSLGHKHKSIIINMAYGASITNSLARHSLTQG